MTRSEFEAIIADIESHLKDDNGVVDGYFIRVVTNSSICLDGGWQWLNANTYNPRDIIVLSDNDQPPHYIPLLSIESIQLGDRRTMPQEKLTTEEHATILAALRFYQEHGQGDPNNRTDAIHAIATNEGNVISLDENAIDDLCEKLNTDLSELIWFKP